MSQRADLSKLEIAFINKAILTELFAAKATGAKEEAMLMPYIKHNRKMVAHQADASLKL